MERCTISWIGRLNVVLVPKLMYKLNVKTINISSCFVLFWFWFCRNRQVYFLKIIWKDKENRITKIKLGKKKNKVGEIPLRHPIK